MFAAHRSRVIPIEMIISCAISAMRANARFVVNDALLERLEINVDMTGLKTLSVVSGFCPRQLCFGA